jgi:hypothetical protein
MGGFTQDDGYVRGVAADAQRFTGSLFDVLLAERNFSLYLNPWYRYQYRANTACHGV